MRFFIAAAAIAVIGCGSDPAKLGAGGGDTGGNEAVTEAQQDDDVFYVQAGAELPPCDRENKLIYVQAETTFKICAAGAWANIDLRGPAGTDNRIVKSIGCGGQLGDTVWWASYSVALMASGDVFVSGSVRNGVIEASSSRFYSGQQVGAETAATLVQFDGVGDATAGYWTLSLDRTTLVSSVVYKDADHAKGGESWSMTPDKCTVNDYTAQPATALTSSRD